MGMAILGAGSWGTALAVNIAKNSPLEQIWLWGRNKHTKNLKNLNFPNNLYFTTDLNLTINHATDLLIAVPSNAFKDLIKQISLVLKNNNRSYRIAWATKGMDADTGRFFSEIIRDYISPDLPIAILSGPSFAQEVLDQIPTAVVLAFVTKDQEFADELWQKLSSKTFKLYFNHDLIGVQLGGVFKNVLAVATGICDGMGFGANTRSALITRGLAEILKLAEKLNADPKTLIGLSGIGDIILTCCNEQSRNRRFGLLLAKGLTIMQAKLEIGQAIEALDNIDVLYKISQIHKVDMPILLNMQRILCGKISILQAIEVLLAKENKVE